MFFKQNSLILINIFGSKEKYVYFNMTSVHNEAYSVGIDIGTSGIRLLLLNTKGKVIIEEHLKLHMEMLLLVSQLLAQLCR